MRLTIRFPLRHPLYPHWRVTPARFARNQCVALSGTLRELLRAGAYGIRAERALFVVHMPDSPFLTDSDRDALWESFQVPAYAVLLDGEGRLVGYECEVQDGMHIGAVRLDTAPGNIFSDDSVLGYRVPLDHATVETSPCACGREGQRLRMSSRVPPRRFEVIAPRNEEVA
jgi:hypothetical protein